jgi:NAD(P)-dependent dehydrogenase (short-subunit alcohol dehydrogenase family)
MTLFDLTDNVAVVTGATKGIGRGIVERLCEHGAKVVVSSRNQAECDETARELNARHGGGGKTVAVGIAADLLDVASLKAMVDKALAQFGRIDTLVCNAAILPFIGLSVDTPPAQFSRVIEGNIHNTFRLCHMVLPGMRARKSGCVIIIGSVSGVNAAVMEMAYGISKAAQSHMAKSLAAEVVGDGVRVNCVAPGLIRSYSSTPLWQDPKVLEPFLGGIPLHRIGEPDDIAGGVIFLASAAGSYVTGATIAIDGGRSTVPVPSEAGGKLDDIYSAEHTFN